MGNKKIISTIFILIGSIFYIFPANIQLPFRIALLLWINSLVLRRLNRKDFYKAILIFLFTVIYTIYSCLHESFHTSLIMVILSIFPLVLFNNLNVSDTIFKNKTIQGPYYLWLISILIQICIYDYHGRPNLSYEINQSASYLLLLYIFSDVIGKRIGKIIIALLSLLFLSRMLILGIILVEVLKRVKYFLTPIKKGLNYTMIVIFANIATILFSSFFLIRMVVDNDVEIDGVERIGTFTDGSNFARFKTNMLIIQALTTDKDPVLFRTGYGDLGSNNVYKDNYTIMPHNELLKAIGQFGIWFALFCFIIIRKNYGAIISYDSIEYFVPILLCSLFLWVRFCIVPSLEMFFIWLILKQVSNEKNSNNYI